MPAVPTVFLAPTLSEARHAAWQFVAQSSAVSPIDPPVVFTGGTGAEQWRDLARSGTHHAITAPRLIRAEEFFARAHSASTHQRFLSGADRLWVLADVLARAAQQEATTKGRDFAAQFATWISALRRSGLAQFPEGDAGEELNVLLRRYEAHLQRLKAFDIEAGPALFVHSVERNRAFQWPRALIVDDLLDPSPVLQTGFKALLTNAQCVAVPLACPGGVEDNSALKNALAFWRSCGARIVRVGDFQAASARSAARVLGEATEVERPANVTVTAAHTAWDEMNRIAAQIRGEVERGARPDEFALAVADMASYELPARHTFAAQGVPLDWPRDRPLQSSPLVRALLGAAQGCRDNWNVHELHDLFGDGTLQLRFGNQNFDARRLRAAARAARFPDLEDIERTKAAFEAKRTQFTSSLKHDEVRNRLAIETSLAAGDLGLVAHFKTLCALVGDKLSATAWQLQFFGLIDILAGHWLDGVGEAATQAQNAIERLREAVLCVVERARGWSDDEHDEVKRPASEWLRWLEMEVEVPTRSEHERAGVRVGSAGSPPEAARTLFFCGFNEGIWPLSQAAGSLGEGGRELNRLLRQHEASPIARATHTVARALSEGSASFSFASYVEGKERPASPVLDDLRAAWPRQDFGVWPELEPLLGRDRSRRAYLVELNRWITAAPPNSQEETWAHFYTLSEMRLQRRNVELGVYDGVLGSRGVALMESWQEMQPNTALSASALERYARCPLRYFFESVLRLEADDEPGEDLDARMAGNLVHAVAQNFIKTWKTPLAPDDFEAALEMLAQITRGECEQLPIRPILREAEYHRLMGADEKSGPLVKWLKLEIGLGNGAWTQEMRPLLHTSLQIEGVQSGLEEGFEIPIGAHTIRGSIDRLDVSPDGSQVSVLDYKTGDISGLPAWKSGDNGLHFQLAIYALAARHLTREFPVPPRLAMAYLSLRSAKIARGIGQDGTLGKGCSGAKSLPDAGFESWLDDVKSRAVRIADLRKAGTFNISLQSASDAKCASCGMKSLCGQQKATQTERLEAHRSSPLFYAPELREWEQGA